MEIAIWILHIDPLLFTSSKTQQRTSIYNKQHSTHCFTTKPTTQLIYHHYTHNLLPARIITLAFDMTAHYTYMSTHIHINTHINKYQDTSTYLALSLSSLQTKAKHTLL